MKKIFSTIMIIFVLTFSLGVTSCNSNKKSTYASSMVYAKVTNRDDTFINVKLIEPELDKLGTEGAMPPDMPTDGNGTTPPDIPTDGSGTTPPDIPTDGSGTTPPDMPTAGSGMTPPNMPNKGFDPNNIGSFSETDISLKLDTASVNISKNNEKINFDEINVGDILLIYFNEKGSPKYIMVVRNN